MKRVKLIITAWQSLTGYCVGHASASSSQQPAPTQPPAATFKSSVDLVRVSAVVRDRKGRFVRDLTVRDFEVLDGGETRPIADFRPTIRGVSIALLFDVSGSMEGADAGMRAKRPTHLLSWLKLDGDEAAVFTFDTRLDEVTPFTSGLQARCRRRWRRSRRSAPRRCTTRSRATAERSATREGLRRAVVVFTDGRDNASRLTPGEVSGIASAIDVPVYIVGDRAVDRQPVGGVCRRRPTSSSALAGPLSDLATWTGGHAFVASTHRPSAAQRRGRSSTSCGISI